MKCELIAKHCQPCEGGISPLKKNEAEKLLDKIPGWSLSEEGKTISRRFEFKGFYKTMSFVNAVAWIANQEGHHPEMKISYSVCEISYTTHAIGGLSENDFICAAKVNELITQVE